MSPLKEKGTFYCQLQKHGFEPKWSVTEQKWICKLAFFSYMIKEEWKKTIIWIVRIYWNFFPFSGKPAILVGVSQVEQNVWKSFKWLFDNLIKENASSHHTPPTVDKWCHLLWKYFTKHFRLESVSNSNVKIKHV